MTALQRRLSTPARANLYWFCYRNDHAASLPEWVRSSAAVRVVTTDDPASEPEAQGSNESGRASTLSARQFSGSASSRGKAALDAAAVLDELIRGFELPKPPLFENPLGFFAAQFKGLLLGDAPDLTENDPYLIRSLVERLDRLSQLEAFNKSSIDDPQFEEFRNAIRESDHRRAIQLASRIHLNQLSKVRLEEIVPALLQSALSLYDNSQEELTAYDLTVAAADRLCSLVGETHAASEQAAKALWNKGLTLGALNRSEEAIAVYDEVLWRFGDASEAALREQVANALVNKGVALGALNRSEEEIAVYDEVLRRFGDASEAAPREQVANAQDNREGTLRASA